MFILSCAARFPYHFVVSVWEAGAASASSEGQGRRTAVFAPEMVGRRQTIHYSPTERRAEHVDKKRGEGRGQGRLVG